MEDEKVNTFFLEDVYKLLDQYPDIRYKVVHKNNKIVIDAQEDPELLDYLRGKIWFMGQYWGATYWKVEY